MNTYFKKKWPWIIWLFVGLLLSGVFLIRWLDSQTKEFVPPKFESLKINRGPIEFSAWWKSSGGDVIIRIESGRKVYLTCGGIFSDSPCFRKKIGDEWRDFEDELSGKTATVWWHPDPKTPDFGRLYQLKIGEQTFISYDSQLEKYLANFKRGHPLDWVTALMFFLIIVPMAIRNLIRH